MCDVVKRGDEVKTGDKRAVFSMRLDPELLQKLDELADRESRTRNNLIELLLSALVNEMEETDS